MKLRSHVFWTVLYGWLALVSGFAILETGPWRWVCELHGLLTKLNPDSLAFTLVVLTLTWPVLVMAYLHGEQVERTRLQQTLSNAAGVGDNPSAPC